MSANSRSSSASVPTVANMGYVSNIPLAVPFAAPPLGIDINTVASRSSPAKLVQYDGLLPDTEESLLNILDLYCSPILAALLGSTLVTGAIQPFTVPSHIPFSQPFPAVRLILVPGGNGFYGSKFP